jgi:hypothetical protein
MKTFMKLTGPALLMVLLPFWCGAQKVEMRDGVRTVHNQGQGIWEKSPRISLNKIKEIGDIEAESEDVAFYMPLDMALDQAGNLHILDTGNHRIQIFSPDGVFLRTIGQKGQGPGEFNFPGSLDIDAQGILIVASPFIKKIQFLGPDGVETDSVTITEDFSEFLRSLNSGELISSVRRRFGLPEEGDKNKGPDPLLQIMDRKGKVIKTFGEPRDYKHDLVNSTGNNVRFAVGGDGHVYVAFRFQNRLEKYTPDGEIVWTADKKLNFNADKPINKGNIERSGGGSISIESPRMNACSEAVAVDDAGRIWVISFDRQLKEEERAGTSVRMSRSDSGSSISMSPHTDEEMPLVTDAYVLDVYDAEGVLLQRFPLDHYADLIQVRGDRLYILDKVRRMQVHVYQLID